MATKPIPDISPEGRRLTREEGFELLENLYGILSGKLDEFGGAAAFYQAERSVWNDDIQAP